MPPTWQWVGTRSFSKEVAVADALPTDPESFPDREYYELQAATSEVTLSCDGMTATEYENLGQTLSARGYLVSVTDQNGKTWTGKFRSLSGSPIPGCNYIEQIQLTIEG